MEEENFGWLGLIEKKAKIYNVFYQHPTEGMRESREYKFRFFFNDN